ncbi:hypothetical protein [Streptodolium elevatio]|uniref:Uncharacterized protein n=1 Tax=Streptodolium elevatio TaxID=3157996 RepID=A0ABV3DHD1_9ACTN
MVKLTGRAAGSIAAAALATGATLMFAPTAHAGTTTGQANCPVPANIQQIMGGKTNLAGPQAYTVNGPATGAAGADVELDVDLGPSPAEVPLDVPGAKLTPTVELKTAGASTAPISVKAAQITMDLKKGGIDLPAFKLKIKIPASATAGKLDLTPTKLTLDVDAMGFKLPMVCTATGTGVVHSITVTAASTTGGTSSASSSSSSSSSTGTSSTGTTGTTGTTSGSSTGSLPKTGPLDDALSMGLVGGTVGLLGIGAVLIATRKVRASRNTPA